MGETRDPYLVIDAEESLLGAAMLSTAEVFSRVDVGPDDFSSAALGELWRRFSALSARGIECDPVTVKNSVASDHGAFVGTPLSDPAQLAGTLAYLFERTPSIENCEHYAAIIQEAALKRRILAKLRELGARASAGMIDDPHEFLDALHAEFLSLQDFRRYDAQTLGDAMRTLLEELSGRAPSEAGVSTGYPSIDEYTGGMRPGAVWILGAPEKTGKSTLAVNIACALAISGKTVAFISQEMSRQELAELALAKLAFIERQKIRLRRLSPAGLDAATRAILDYAPHDRSGMADRFLVVDEGSIPAPRVGPMIRRMARRGARVIFLDYIQRVSYPESRSRPLASVMEASLIEWASAAKREGATLALISQYNREAKNKFQSGAIGGYKGSGAIEEVADVACALDWPWLRFPDGDRSHLKLEILRQRFGVSGVSVDLRFYPEQGRVETWLPQAGEADRDFRDPTDVDSLPDEPF